MRKLLPNAIPALLHVLEQQERHGHFTDQQFLRRVGVGRGTLRALEERDWIAPIDPANVYPRKYQITLIGRVAIGNGQSPQAGESK